MKKSILVAVGLCVSVCSIHAVGNDATEWKRLNVAVDAKEAELAALISQAEAKSINTQYAKVSAHTIRVFQKAAQNDRTNIEKVRLNLQKSRHFEKLDPKAADNLPFNELKNCIEVADFALSELKQQISGAITLTASPDLSNGHLTIGSGSFQLGGRPVFPSSLVWLDDQEGNFQSYGRMGQGYYNIAGLQPDGALNKRGLDKQIASAKGAVEHKMLPYTFFLGHNAAKWMKDKHPEIAQGGRNFTTYDIDSPLIRKWISQTNAAIFPKWSEAAGQPQGMRQRMHLLSNEPHFSVREGGWLARNGLSDHTIKKYHQWLEAKYETIESLNKTYATQYKSFDEVVFHRKKLNKKYQGEETYKTRQADRSLRGGPVWYDLMRFNMDRVNDWFTFLKNSAQLHDGVAAPTTIKLLGHSLSNTDRDGGIDMEYLTKLQEVMGGDLRVIPSGATIYGKHEEGSDTETHWENHYAYDWVDQSMFLDFTKSLCPEKPFYDSEWHGFSGVSWRHYQLKRSYTRSALWLAYSHGMSAIKPWVWGRSSEGALLDKTDHYGHLSTQPIAVDAFGRVMKELNAHAGNIVGHAAKQRQFLIYYCEESAIQDETYMTSMKQVYEALKLTNASVGFVTPSDVSRVDTTTQLVIVPPTGFVSDLSLKNIQEYHKKGGRVAMVGKEKSFLKNELGKDRSEPSRIQPIFSMPMDRVIPMALKLEAVTDLFRATALIDYKITDLSGSKVHGVIVSQSSHPKTGRRSIMINNVSKDPRVITISPRDGQVLKMKDAVTGNASPRRIVLQPCDLRLLVDLTKP